MAGGSRLALVFLEVTMNGTLLRRKVWAKTVQNLTLAWWPGLAGRVTGFAVAVGLEPTHRQQQPR